MRSLIARVTVVLGALSLVACGGGHAGSLPALGVSGPAFATRIGESGPASLLTAAEPAQTQETVLHSFAGNKDGEFPTAGLTDVNGVLYGTTISTVFKITTSGTETVLHTFVVGGGDGLDVEAGLVDVNGVLYGTTAAGGDSNGDGTVFKITPSGAESVLYRFQGGSDGAGPEAALTNIDGVLYGTTFGGGGANNACYAGCGTVFKITTSGNESVLHAFGAGNDGEKPRAGLTDVGGVLYGTTELGGALKANGYRNGTVFKITTSGTENVLHSFGGGNDGFFPYAGLTNVNGVLYGTTVSGGDSNNNGTVFKITTEGVKTAVYRFGFSDGAEPWAPLTYLNGLLYGTTFSGGAHGRGTVFSLSL